MRWPDQDAFARFFEETYRPLWAYVFRGLGDRAMAEDVAQEAYVRLLQARTEGLAPGQLKAYLYRIATNLMRDHWRRRGREESCLDPTAHRPAAPRASSGALHDEIHHAFARLPAKQRALLWLAYVEGYRHREIAEVLRVGHKSVRVLLFRARRKMITLMNKVGIGPEEKE